MIVRELAAAWLHANCPRADLQKTFLQYLDKTLQHRLNCSFIIGRDLTVAGKPFLVECFRGEFFAFELTPAQADRLKVSAKTVVCCKSLFQHDHGPKAAPTVWLEHVGVNHADALDRSAPITGTVRYRTTQFPFDPIAIQVVCEPPDRPHKILFHHLFRLPGPEGTVQFSLDALGDLPDPSGTPFEGIVPLFFQIWMTKQPETPSPIQSALSAMHGVTRSHPPQSPLPPGRPPLGQLQPTLPKSFAPAASPFPPPFNPFQQVAAQATEERPISDIRAVLVEIC